jgi:hypothetical protein
VRSRRLRCALAVVFALALVLAFIGFDRFGADCGDAIRADGGEAFTCNGAAQLLMAVGAIGLAGLVGTAVWTLVAWRKVRSRRLRSALARLPGRRTSRHDLH